MQVSREKKERGNRREAFSLSGCAAKDKKSVFFTRGKWHILTLYLNPAANVFTF